MGSLAGRHCRKAVSQCMQSRRLQNHQRIKFHISGVKVLVTGRQTGWQVTDAGRLSGKLAGSQAVWQAGRMAVRMVGW